MMRIRKYIVGHHIERPATYKSTTWLPSFIPLVFSNSHLKLIRLTGIKMEGGIFESFASISALLKEIGATRNIKF